MTTSAKKSPPSLMLLDSASMYFRAFFGVPEIKADDGTPVNAVRGFMDFIARLVGAVRPRPARLLLGQRLAAGLAGRAAADVQDPPRRGRTRLRRRTSRRCRTRSRCRCRSSSRCSTPSGSRVRGADGYEADDVIGTLATGADGPVDVVTGDRDLFQVVDDDADVRVLYIARGVGNHERVDNAWMRAKYGVDAAQYADFATLRGDASDGLPGVAGIGEKTAATLLNRFGDMAGIIAAAGDPDSDLGPGPRGKIKAAADYLTVAPKVVAVARDIDLDRTGLDRPVTPRDPDAVTELARALQPREPGGPPRGGPDPVSRPLQIVLSLFAWWILVVAPACAHARRGVREGRRGDGPGRLGVRGVDRLLPRQLAWLMAVVTKAVGHTRSRLDVHRLTAALGGQLGSRRTAGAGGCSGIGIAGAVTTAMIVLALRSFTPRDHGPPRDRDGGQGAAQPHERRHQQRLHPPTGAAGDPWVPTASRTRPCSRCSARSAPRPRRATRSGCASTPRTPSTSLSSRASRDED